MIGKNFQKATKNTKSTKESRVAGGTREESGRESTRTRRKPLRGQERLESGWGETTWTNPGQLFHGAPPELAACGKRRE
jgi:hypothetical protein